MQCGYCIRVCAMIGHMMCKICKYVSLIAKAGTENSTGEKVVLGDCVENSTFMANYLERILKF